MDDVFYPNVSDLHLGAPPAALTGWGRHGEMVYQTHVAGRDVDPAPFLLNFSEDTPEAIQLLIDRGVRVFSFSSALRNFEWTELKKVIESNPETLFIASTPHISGNSVSTWELAESPSRFARELPNVWLAGSVEY